MKRQITWMVLALFLGPIAATSVYAADQPAGSAPSSKGGEEAVQIDKQAIRGKLVKVEDQLYTVETSPGKQERIRVDKATKFEGDFKGMEGDWIEGIVLTRGMNVESLKKSTPGYTVEGNVLKVEGDLLVVKDDSGKEIRLQTSGDTKMDGSHKVGERIRAEYTPDGKVLSVKPTKMMRGPAKVFEP